METYRVRIGGGNVRFAAAHFISLGEGACERLHGHNYRVGAELTGRLDADRTVYDFLVLKRMLRRIVEPVDHRVILPARSPRFRIEERGPSIRVALGAKEWVFPRDDCALLPIENSTAEEIAAWIGGRLVEELARVGLPKAERVAVEVEEGDGQAAVHETGGGQ